VNQCFGCGSEVEFQAAGPATCKRISQYSLDVTLNRPIVDKSLKLVKIAIFKSFDLKLDLHYILTLNNWVYSGEGHVCMFTPGQHIARQQVVGIMCRIAVNVSYIDNKTVASLLSVCCWIQRVRDTSRPWHKWIVIMSLISRYSQHVSRTSNFYPATWCVRQQYVCGYKLLVRATCCRRLPVICIPNEQFVSDNMCPSTCCRHFLPATCCHDVNVVHAPARKRPTFYAKRVSRSQV